MSHPLLTRPHKTTAGYILATADLSANTSPPLRFTISATTSWCLTPEWSRWAEEKRLALIEELVSNPRWFTRAPSRDIVETLFTPWTGTTMRGESEIFCEGPAVSPVVDVSGSGSESGPTTGTASWSLVEIVLTSTSITPRWKLTSLEWTPTAAADADSDCISIFGHGSDTEDKEIRFEDIEEAAPEPGTEVPTRLRARNWDIHKSAAKQRVREARLKSQIASRIAEKEEMRFFRKYGDIEDGESRFSEYDSTDDEGEDEEDEEDEDAKESVTQDF